MLGWPWYQEHLRVIYPDLRVGDLGPFTGSQPLELIRHNWRDRPVVIGDPVPTIGLYFVLRQADGFSVVEADRAETNR